ncbi:hypothetical protein P3748_16855 [Vibrio parahaemolyticus]|nr:hypothetical protein [Vibrio parahaemolyticus]MDF4975196.1 hypothetical protein [Vibrio parahaemolyticus]MDF5038148.1 hypothetical protein [Vibrio parahaemolyticus]MDF5686891.1 hypothetical protein [Vibrio parahaemolyticus]
MNATAIAYWLIFLGLLPVTYWGFRMLFENLLLKFLPPHQFVIEQKDNDGNIVRSDKITVNGQKFYDEAFVILGKSSKKHG